MGVYSEETAIPPPDVAGTNVWRGRDISLSCHNYRTLSNKLIYLHSGYIYYILIVKDMNIKIRYMGWGNSVKVATI